MKNTWYFHQFVKLIIRLDFNIPKLEITGLNVYNVNDKCKIY